MKLRDNEQLDIKLRAVLSQAVDEFNKLNKSAISFDKSLTNIVTKTDKLGKTTQTATFLGQTSKELQKLKITADSSGKVLNQTFTQTAKTGKNLKNGLSSVFDANKLYLYWNLTKRLRTSLANAYNSAVDYIETQNKFNVSMGDAKPQAVRFVNQMSEAIGIAKAELMDYQSTYKNILSGLGNFTDYQSERISESLVKMAIDYSSMYNVGQADAMNKFQSALVGSIRPIRSDSGYDVSDTTIGAKAQELGIDRSVNQLNQMEKRMLRIIVLMEQLRTTGAMGDLARTIEQPANQMRVLKAQIQEVGVWIGNVFMGTVGKVLPYINAFVMVIKELIKMLAIFTGYTGDNTDLTDVFEAVEDSSAGVAGNLGNASKKAKELRKTLMGFDVLNVINTPTESKGSGGGGSGLGTIDPAILGALGDYDSMMEKVRMKATDIRDKIMDWLGYTKIIDPLTGEISWKLREGYQNIEKIKDVLKTIGTIFAGYKISTSVINFLDKIGVISNKKQALKIALGISVVIAGANLIFNGISKAIDQGYLDEETIMNVLSGGALTFFGGKFLLGLSLSASALLTIDIIGLAFLWKSKKIGKDTLAGWLAEKYLPSEISDFVQIYIGITKVTWKGLEKILPEEKIKKLWKDMMKRVITTIAQFVSNIPIIGESMADAIMAGVEASEKDMSETIKYTSEKALKEANPWIQDNSKELGRDSATAYSNGFRLEKENTRKNVETTLKESIEKSKEAVKQTSNNLGRESGTSTSEGYKSKREELIASISETTANSLKDSKKTTNTLFRDNGKESIDNWVEGLSKNKKERDKKIISTASSFASTWKSNFKSGTNINVSDLMPKESKWKTFAQSMSKAFWNNFSSGKVSVNTQSNGNSTLRVQPYSLRAEGGPVSVGEMFIAREAGPELVGRIGNTTTVMNNQQIVQAVSQGVAQAVASVMGNGRSGDIRLIVDGREITSIVEERILRNQNIYGIA